MNSHGLLIAGHGQMGHAFEKLLKGRGPLAVWDVAPGKMTLDAAAHGAAAQAEFVFAGVPTLALASVLAPLLPLLPAQAAVISIAKGLDDTGAAASDILRAAMGHRPWGVMGGPMVAAEILAGREAYAELGARDVHLPQRMRSLFAGTGLHLAGTATPAAVSWCGVLKNVYAPVVGLADGFNLGANVRGHILMGALAEMRSLVPDLSGEDGSVLGDAGLADFAATVTSPDSHHYNLGRDMARGESGLVECEGIHSLRVLRAGRRVDLRRFPLYAAAEELLDGIGGARAKLHGWLERDTPHPR